MREASGRRPAIAVLLVVVLLLSNTLPGMAAEITQPPETVPAETEMTVETTVQTEPTWTESASPETTSATEVMQTIPQETEELTVPTESTETEITLYAQFLEILETLKAEAGNLPAELDSLDAFAGQLRDLWNEIYDAYDRELLTEEELSLLDEMGWEILDYLEQEYRYVDGVITPLDIPRQGSQQTPLPATADNSVETLGSGSGIKFRIFNYTNGKDANGNYITAGGINDNGLTGYFDFRGTSYENTGADGKQVSNYTNSVTDIDGYTANHATVLPNLGSDGYPVFDGSRDGGPQKSLGYLFGAGGKGVTGYAPGNTLLRLNSRGQYYYNSANNAADFDTESNRFIVRTYRERGQTTANQGSGQYYDFFPFTYWNGTTKEASGTDKWYNYTTSEVDYWYGMTMEATFSMPEGGRVQQDPMVFEFSGDDDVWVFIDDVLVLDLGGTHGVVSGSINFATGQVKQYLDWNGAGENSTGTSYPTTLKARFEAAGKEPKGGWNGNVFANYSEHTIKFYYLERATSCANCKILFNMPILPTGKLLVEKQMEGPQTAFTKEEAYGFALVQQTEGAERPASGIRFDRIDVSSGAVLETGTTDSQGQFTLKAGQRAEFDLTAGKTYLVRETDSGQYAVPAGCILNGVLQPESNETEAVTIDPNAPAAAVFQNRLKTTELTVKKLVDGNMGDRDLPFSFRVRLYSADPGKGGVFLSFSVPGDGYSLEDGEAHFQLKHNRQVVLRGIPMGAWVSITEIATEGYDTVWQSGEDSGWGRVAVLPDVTAPAPLVYTNTREVLIDTGVSLDTAPYLLMTAGGILPLLRRRRKRE